MVKRFMLFSFLLVIGICIIGCNKSQKISGKEIFGERLDSVSEIRYYFPNETVCMISDTVQIDKICNILLKEVYFEEKNKSEIEGGYLFDFVGEDVFEISLVQKYLRYNGNEYAALNDNAFSGVYSIVDSVREVFSQEEEH